MTKDTQTDIATTRLNMPGANSVKMWGNIDNLEKNYWKLSQKLDILLLYYICNYLIYLWWHSLNFTVIPNTECDIHTKRLVVEVQNLSSAIGHNRQGYWHNVIASSFSRPPFHICGDM